MLPSPALLFPFTRPTGSSTAYFPLAAGNSFSTSGNAQSQVTARALPGKCHRLAIKLDGTGTSRVLKTFNNGFAAKQAITIADGASGTFEDISNFDSLADGDAFGAFMTYSGSAPTVYWIRAVHQGYDNNIGYWRTNYATVTNNAATLYGVVFGTTGWGSETGGAAFVVRAAATLKYFGVQAVVNGVAATSTVKFRKNATDQLTINITAST